MKKFEELMNYKISFWDGNKEPIPFELDNQIEFNDVEKVKLFLSIFTMTDAAYVTITSEYNGKAVKKVEVELDNLDDLNYMKEQEIEKTTSKRKSR